MSAALITIDMQMLLKASATPALGTSMPAHRGTRPCWWRPVDGREIFVLTHDRRLWRTEPMVSRCYKSHSCPRAVLCLVLPVVSSKVRNEDSRRSLPPETHYVSGRIGIGNILGRNGFCRTGIRQNAGCRGEEVR